jgi:hypothetical protein
LLEIWQNLDGGNNQTFVWQGRAFTHFGTCHPKRWEIFQQKMGKMGKSDAKPFGRYPLL